MFIKTLFLLLSSLPLLYAINADLILVEYEPLIFELRFSENVSRTNFQLLYNNLHNITYVYETDSTFSSLYRFQADTSKIEKTTTLQSYNLLFNNPLNVGNGKLDISSYTITAKKSDIMIKFPTYVGILLVLSGYFFNTITGIGKQIIQFMQIYVLFIFSTRMTTTLNQQICQTLMLIPPKNIMIEQIEDYQTFILCCLIIPFFLIIIFAVIGTLYKRFSSSVKEKSILKTIIYDEFVFNSLIKSTRLFWFNLFYNSLMFTRLTRDQTLSLKPSTVQVGYIFVYFNILTCVSLLYLKFFILNPNITKRQENVQKYYKSKQFHSFSLLHQRLHLSPWYKRNYDIFQSLKMFILIGIFFNNNIFQYFALLFQFMHVFFIFTVRPLVLEFYQNAKFIVNLLIFTEYLLIVLGNLYFSIGEAIFNYYSASKYIIARDTLFLLIELVIIGVVFGQIYFKCSNLSYQIKLVKEAESYKLQFVSKNKQEVGTKDRKYTATTYSEHFSKSQEKRAASLSEVGSPTKKRESIKANLKVSDELKPSLTKRRKSRLQLDIQLEDIKKDIQKEIRRQKSKSLKESQKSLPRKRKWRQESLLEGIVKTK